MRRWPTAKPIMDNEPANAKKWYEIVYEASGLSSDMPELQPFINAKNMPAWVKNVLVELYNQTSPGIAIEALQVRTPENVGRLRGQQYANYYALLNRMEKGMQAVDGNPAKVCAILESFEKNKGIPIVGLALNALHTVGSLITDLIEKDDLILQRNLEAFRMALEQPSHQEAADFFKGFALGIAKKGFTKKGAARATNAFGIYFIMLIQWQAIDRLPSVPAFRDYLLQRGLSESVLGDISRLRKLCSRIGYAPGKRGRPPRQ